MADRRGGVKLRQPARCAAGLLGVALACGSARGLINQNYTPVDVVHQSETTLRLQVGPWDQTSNRLAVKVVGETLKGKVPRDLAPAVDSPDEAVTDAIEKILEAHAATPAGRPALFGKRAKGPLTLKWTFGASKRQNRRVIVLRPTRLVPR